MNAIKALLVAGLILAGYQYDEATDPDLRFPIPVVRSEAYTDSEVVGVGRALLELFDGGAVQIIHNGRTITRDDAAGMLEF